MHWPWLGFFALVGVLLLVLRKTTRVSTTACVVWFAGGFAFVGLVWPMYEYGWFGATLVEASDNPGTDAATMFLSAYLLEFALSLDTIFVLWLWCHVYRVPRAQHARLISWALVVMIVVRVMILGSGALLARNDVWPPVFGAVTLISGLAALTPGDDDDGSMPRNPRTFGGVCLVVATSDIVFAFDSIAVLSVSKTTFIVVTSNVLATITVRSLFLNGVTQISFPRIATAALLGIAGAKLAFDRGQVSHWAWLATIVGIIGFGLLESMRQSGASTNQ